MVEPFLSSSSTSLILLLCTLLLSGESALVISLREPEQSAITVATKRDQTRTLNLVTNRTYYLSCRDNSPNGMFDISSNNIWWHDGIPVQKISSRSSFPSTDRAAIFSSTMVHPLTSNEWTLVIQKLGVANMGVGVFSCRGLNGELESFEIREVSYTVIAGDPHISIVAGSGDRVSLAPLISPPHSTLQWLYNGSPAPQAFPEGVAQHQSELLFSRTITTAMSGNYTCVAMFDGGISSVSDSFIVVVNVLPRGELWPPSLTGSQVFNDTRFTVSCTDRTGVPPSHSITWNRNGIPLISDSRVSATFVSNSSIASSELVIDPVLPDDVGDYSCETVNLAGTTQTSSFSLTHVLIVSKLEHSTVYQEASTITLQIHVPGSSPSSTSETFHHAWQRNGLDLSDSTKYSARESLLPDGASIYALDVLSARGEDSGIYSCELSTDVSAKVVTFDYVGVVSLAVTSSLNVLSGDAVKVGNNISLICKAEFANIPSSFEALEVTMLWGRTGDVSLAGHVTMSDSLARMSSGANRHTYGNNLMFSPALRGDGGGYVCTVSYRIAAGGEFRVHRHESSLDIDSVLFQLRFLGITSSCQEWKSSGLELKLNSIKNSTLLRVNQLCLDCTLTSSHITAAGFHCFSESPEAVTYRAKLHGTSSASSSVLLAHILAWTRNDKVLQLSNIEASFDPSCPLKISSIDSAECAQMEENTVGPEAGVSMVMVIGVGVAASVVLLLFVALIVSLVLCGARRRRHGSGAMETAKQKHVPDSSIPVKAVNPGLEGTEPEYEDLDKFMVTNTSYSVPGSSYSVPGSSYVHMSSVKVPDNHMCQHDHLTYDYAAV